MSLNKNIRFSIITVTYNAEEVIEKTIRSVMEQEYPDLEYIIIDGGSKDSTVDLIKKYESVISYWVSEPDNGLYDAMNKGMRQASGDYVWFLNAGDVFAAPGVIHALREVCANRSLPDILYGETCIIDDQGNVVGMRRLKAPEQLSWKSFKWGMLVCHQAFIVKRELAGFYDLQYRIAADFDWCIRCMKKAGMICNTHQVLVAFLEDGMSTKHRKAALKERYRIMCHYYGKFLTGTMHLWFALRFYFAKWVKGRV